MTRHASPVKVLVFGAGVLGSLYAARLADAGHDVSLVARGRRFDDLQAHGIVLEYFDTGMQTTTRVGTLDAMPVDERFDVCLVAVRKTQLADALPVLATNPRIPSFLFMLNTAEGPQAMIDALGRERVMLGFANAGGERDGHLVRLMVAKGKAVRMGELDGVRSERLLRIGTAFQDGGFQVAFNHHMDAWLRYHVAMVAPMANGFYLAGGSNVRLSRDRKAVQTALRATREGFAVIRAHGFPIEPSTMRWFLALPDFIAVPMIQRLLATALMDIGGARHALAAREEMTVLNEELPAASHA